MSWIGVGEWAEQMDARLRAQRRQRVKLAAEYFGLDALDVLGDSELEERLLRRYEATGRSWPEPAVEEE